MPIADDPDPRPSDRPGPEGDPFEGLVLDEEFVRGAPVKEAAARTRMLTARWRFEPPVDPGGRRWSPTPAPRPVGRRRFRPWHVALAAGVAALTLLGVAAAPAGGLFNALSAWRERAAEAPAPRPAADVPLPGGGTSDGSRCGAAGYHWFGSPTAAVPVSYRQLGTSSVGPLMRLASYGFERKGDADRGRFLLDLEIVAIGDRPMDLSAPLGPQGVAVELEGPAGLLGGAHGLPVTLDPAAPHTADGRIRVAGTDGVTAHVTLPAEALCPGVDLETVHRQLVPRVDTDNTVTGGPAVVLTASISDPAIGALRRATGSTEPGDVLTTDNRLPKA